MADPEIEGVEVVRRPALTVSPVEMPADGALRRTLATFRVLKHFFDTVYYPSLDHVSGRPYGLWVHGNNDTVDAAVRERAYELGGTLAATLMQ